MKIDTLAQLKNAACNACDVAWEATREAREAREVAWDACCKVDRVNYKEPIVTCGESREAAHKGNAKAWNAGRDAWNAYEVTRDSWHAYEVARDACEAAYKAAFLVAYNDSYAVV